MFIGDLKTEGNNIVVKGATRWHVGSISDFTVSPMPTPPIVTFANYAASLPQGLQGETDDADNDGLANIVEYALNSNANDPSDRGFGLGLRFLPGRNLGIPGDLRNYLYISVPIRAFAEDVEFEPRLLQYLGGPPVEGVTFTLRTVGADLARNRILAKFYVSTFPVEDYDEAFISAFQIE
jgi:hypothetical protein